MSTAEPQKPASLPGVKSLILFWVIFGLLGFIAPYTINWITELGYVQWEKLVPAPPKMDKLLGDKSGLILVRTTTGQTLSCNPYNRDECWIADINQSDTKKNCDLNSGYFQPQTHPPRDIIDCVDVQAKGGEYLYRSVYALDQQGYIWHWLSRGPGELQPWPISVLILGVFGLLIGSGVWTIRWYLKKRSLSKKQIPTIGRIRSFALWTLVALPLLCVIGFVVPPGIHLRFPVEPFFHIKLLNICGDPTADAISTAYAQPFLMAVTPNPSGPAYDFASECGSAMWYVGYQHKINCSAHSFGIDAIVDVVDLQATDWRSGFSGNALQFNLPAPDSDLKGNYPVWKVQPGDHFQATLGCKSNITDCNVVFSFLLVKRDLSKILQGQWVVTADRPSTDIDVDLSKFASQQVLFQLSAAKLYDSGTSQSIMLVNPRIINLPQK